MEPLEALRVDIWKSFCRDGKRIAIALAILLVAGICLYIAVQ